VAAAITVAYEHGRAPAIRAAITEYARHWRASKLRGDIRGFDAGTVDELFDSTEREAMIQVGGLLRAV
jgi:hypothetical protein